MNSSTTFYAPPVSWPYAVSSSSISASSVAKFGGNSGQYSSAASGLVHPSGNTYTASTHFSAQSFNHPVAMPMLATPSRHAYGSNYGNSFNDELVDPYTVPGAQYLVPAHDFASTYQAQDMPRPSWRPLSISTSAHLNPSIDQDATMRYGSAFPYYNSSASSASSVMTDGSGPFPGLGSLATSLPLHANNANRTLPNPTAKRGSIQSITNASLGALHDSTLPFCVPQNMGGKNSVSWSNENVTGGGAQGTTAVTLATSGITEGSNGKQSSPPQRSRDNSTFGYYQMSHTPLNMSSPQPGDYPTFSESSTSEGQLGSSESLYHPRVSGDTMLSSQSPSSNLYSYSVVGTGRYGSTTDSISEGTLTNGQPYTRLRQPEPQHVPSLDPLRGDSLESNSRHAQAASISGASTRHY